MNNVFSKGLLTISVVALYGCNNSVDLTAEQSSSTTSHAPTSLVVATPPATVVGVVNITNEVTTDTTKVEDGVSSSTSSVSSSEAVTNTNSGTAQGQSRQQSLGLALATVLRRMPQS